MLHFPFSSPLPPRLGVLALVLAAGAPAARAEVRVTLHLPETPFVDSACVPLRATVSGRENQNVIWTVREGRGECFLDATGTWFYRPPKNRLPDTFENVELMATTASKPEIWARGVLVLQPTDPVFDIINLINNEGDGAGIVADTKAGKAEAPSASGSAPSAAAGSSSSSATASSSSAIYGSAPWAAPAPPSPAKPKRKAEGGDSKDQEEGKTQEPAASKRRRTGDAPSGQAGTATAPPARPTWMGSELAPRPLQEAIHSEVPFTAYKVGPFPPIQIPDDMTLVTVGYKARLTLDWNGEDLPDHSTQDLSLTAMGHTRTLDVVGQTHQELVPVHDTTVELEIRGPADSKEGVLLSQMVHVRGLVPLAGIPGVTAGPVDGPVTGARFGRPLCAENIREYSDDGEELWLKDAVAFTEAGHHSIRVAILEDHHHFNEGKVESWAGHARTPGFLDGAGSDARFRNPSFLFKVDAGKFLVADTDNHALRLVNGPSGMEVTTVAGFGGHPGLLDGQGMAALFNRPMGITDGPDREFYVADNGNHVIRKISVRTTASPVTCRRADGKAMEVRFNHTQGVARIGDGLYVLSGTALMRIDLATQQISSFCDRVDQAAILAHTQMRQQRQAGGRTPDFSRPVSIRAEGTDLYVLFLPETSGSLVPPIKFSSVTRACTCVLGWMGLDPVSRWNFLDPDRNTADGPGGTAFEVEPTSGRIVKQTHAYTVTTLACREPEGPDGKAGAAPFADLRGMARIGRDLFVLDGHAVRRVNLDSLEVTTLCGQVDRAAYAAHGRLKEGERVMKPSPCLNDPWEIKAQGPDLYVTDRGNHSVVRISSVTGEWTVLAGGPRADRKAPKATWGLLRDGIPEPEEPAAHGADQKKGERAPKMGALPEPQAMALVRNGILVSTPGALALVAHPDVDGAVNVTLPRFSLKAVEAKREVAHDEIFSVELLLEQDPNAAGGSNEMDLAMEYEVQVLNGDGTEACPPRKGILKRDRKAFLQVFFTKASPVSSGTVSSGGSRIHPGRVVVRGRTREGVGVFPVGGDLEYTVK